MGDCSTNCNPCGPSYDGINQLATQSAVYARQAKTSADKAENSWLEFNALYLGAFASAPTVDNEGNPLQVGALYWNSVSNELFVWSGTSWTITTNFNEFTPFLATGTTTARNLVTRMADVVNVLDFGADPTGVINSATQIQNAINYANSSATKKIVYIPSGKYKLTSQLEMYSNIVLMGDSKETTVFDYSSQTSGNFIQTTPTVGSPIPLSSNIGRYDTQVATTAAHGASVGDKYAILSQRNALSRDGGDWQLGIGTGSLKASYYSEILNVSNVVNANTFDFYPPLVFPSYNTDDSQETPNTTRVCNIPTVASGNYDFTITLASGTTTGLVEGMFLTGTGIPSNYVVRISAIINSTQIRVYSSSNAGFVATNGTTLTFSIESRPNTDIRKVTFVDNVKIKNITFISGTGNNKINFYGANNGLVENCKFYINAVGEAINFINCYETKAIKCHVIYKPGIATTYNYNPFSNISSWNCGYEDCVVENCYQGFDVTYSGGIFGTSTFSPAMFAYVDRCLVKNSENGMTSHSGSYGVKVTNNTFLNCQTGILVRSPNGIYTNNFITGIASASGVGGQGIILSNFAYKSLVSNNSIEGFEEGIYILPEVSTLGYGIKNVRTNISNNIIKRTSVAIRIEASNSIYHENADLMNVIINGNTISESAIHIFLEKYSNGVSIADNNFIGPISNYGSIQNSIYIANNCFSINIRDNSFTDIGNDLPISVGTLTDTTVYPSSNYRYKTNMVFWSGNKFFGNTIGAQQIFATGADPNIDNKYIDSGSYTPTIADQTNVSSVTLGLCNFSVKDRVCTVSGRISITATNASQNTSVKLNLPIPTDISVTSTNATINGTAIANDLNGIVSAKISGDVSTNTAILGFLAPDTVVHEIRYIYQYAIF